MRDKEIPDTISEASTRIRDGSLSCTELVEVFLDRIEERNSSTNSYISVYRDEALEHAAEADRAVKAGYKLGPLHGIPVAVKDLFDVRGRKTTAGSKARDDYVAQEDCTAVEKLRKAGAIILGKLNLHEFAFGPTSLNTAFGPVRNPSDTDRIAGGSSGGSAAAVADGLCLGALGTDTGGSIRIPASLCGVVGLKPTIGVTSRYGVFPLAWTLDNVGPLTRTVQDSAILLDAISGYDARDPLSVRIDEYGFASSFKKVDLSKLRVGILEDFLFPFVEREIEEKFRRIAGELSESVHEIKSVRVPFAKYYKPIADMLMSVEASAVHEELMRKRFEDYGSDVRPKILAGGLISASQYLQAQQVKIFLSESLAKIFSDVELLVLPSTPITAPRVDEKTVRVNGEQYSVNTILGALCRPFSLSGLPAMSVPCGLDSRGLPMGFQVAGDYMHDSEVLALGALVESKVSV